MRTAWLESCNDWWHRSRQAEAVALEDEIEEELMFHVRSLVDEQMVRGVPFDEAWNVATDRFGSLRRYAAECRQIAAPRQWPWRLGLLAGLLLLSSLVGWLLLEVRALRHEYVALRLAPSPIEEFADPTRLDLTGSVCDRQGAPLAHAQVLVILKTWPDDRYRQDAYHTKSDAQGRFRLAGLVPDAGRYCLLVSVVQDGFTLTSEYRVVKDERHAAVDPFELRCDRAARLTLLLHDDEGEPLSQVKLYPSGRKTPEGDSHLVYGQAAAPIEQTTDAEGKVTLACFQRGDEAELYIRAPGDKWIRRSFTIPAEDDLVRISLEG